MAQYLVHQSISWELISISTIDVPIDLASISTHHHLTNCFMPEGWLSSCKISTLHTWWLLHFFNLKQICTVCAISPYWNDTCRLIHFSWQAINNLSYNTQHWQPYALLAFYFTILVVHTGKKTVPRQKGIYLREFNSNHINDSKKDISFSFSTFPCGRFSHMIWLPIVNLRFVLI